ncbi:heterotrimeric G protein alpha subunit 4, partial [Gymnopus androsaceus JB14]
VLLLGSGDSGKSTFLKQMRLLHHVPFSAKETESYRQVIFSNLTQGMKYILDAMQEMDLNVTKDNISHVDLIDNATNLRDGEAFPQTFLTPLTALWEDPNIRHAYERGNEAALPANLKYYFSEIDRLFQPNYQPTEQDIMHARVPTTGITETTLSTKNYEMILVDVGGQRSERRKWIHCFQGVSSIVFLVSLSGYDLCLVEGWYANQMQDAITIWDTISHSQWFRRTSLILFFTKNDLFEEKIPNSDIKNFFPDYDGESGDVKAGRDYFKKRFGRLAQKADKTKERDIYIHTTTTTTIDSVLLRVVMAAVEGLCFDNLRL